MKSLLRVLIIILLTPGLLPGQEIGTHPISGRRFSKVMDYRGAAWLDREERNIEEEPDRALDAINIKQGEIVADIGAGSGFMVFRMAKRVGMAGRVYAEDIQPEMIELLKKLIVREKLTNVKLVLGSVDDPKLPPSSVDLALLVDVYHEFSEPQKMLRGLRTALKSNGRLVLLEYRKEDPLIPIRHEHKMTVAEAKMEVEAEGFMLSKVEEHLPRQHILVFTKSASKP